MKHKDTQVFRFAGMTVIPTHRITPEHTPALCAVIGSGIGLPGGYFARKNIRGKYDIIQIDGVVIQRNLSYHKMQEFKRNNRNRQLSEIKELFDNILLFEHGKGGMKPYREDERASEDTIADRYAQIMHDYGDYSGGEGNHDFTFSDVLESANHELALILETGNKPASEIISERREREANGGYTLKELREMESAHTKGEC